MGIKEIIEQLENPQGTLGERLERLQKEFPAKKVSILLDLQKDHDFEIVLKDYVESLERLEAYVRNGHSVQGLEKYYDSANIRVF